MLRGNFANEYLNGKYDARRGSCKQRRVCLKMRHKPMQHISNDEDN